MAKVSIETVKVGTRFRKEAGDIEKLAASIKDLGLLHPLVVDNDYNLVSGWRRLQAVIANGDTEVVVRRVDGLEDAQKALRAEAEENSCREDFTPLEACSLGIALEKTERLAAKARMGNPVNFTGLEKGDVRDKIGRIIGYSGVTYEKIKKIMEATEEEPEVYGDFSRELGKDDARVDNIYKRFVKRKENPKGLISEESGWVYIFRAENGLFKIGKTSKNPKGRLASIGKISPVPINLLHKIKTNNITWLESSLHSKYASKRIHGEWFKLEEKNIRWLTKQISIDTNVSKHPDVPLIAKPGTSETEQILKRSSGYFKIDPSLGDVVGNNLKSADVFLNNFGGEGQTLYNEVLRLICRAYRRGWREREQGYIERMDICNEILAKLKSKRKSK